MFQQQGLPPHILSLSIDPQSSLITLKLHSLPLFQPLPLAMGDLIPPCYFSLRIFVKSCNLLFARETVIRVSLLSWATSLITEPSLFICSR